MLSTPKDYAARLVKNVGSDKALDIAEDAFVVTRETALPEFKETKDARLRSKVMKDHLKVGKFWDNVFGIVLKKVHPHLTRKQYLSRKAEEKEKGTSQ